MSLRRDSSPGDLYVDAAGALYRVIGYQPSPTVIIERIAEPSGAPVHPDQLRREHHAVGCLNADEFTYLATLPRFTRKDTP